MKHSDFVVFILLLMVTNLVFAQASDNNPKTYRVVAINKADLSIQSVSNEIDLYLPMKIYLPTAFTPNGDGVNDTFGAVGEGIEGYRLSIFNRWGELVFQSSSQSQKWDGYSGGKKAPVGVYNYELLAHGKELGQVHKSGFVTVVN